MLKKMLIVSILFLLIVSFSNTTEATTTPALGGYYQIVGGKVSASLNFPSYLTLSVNLPNLAVLKDLLGVCFAFGYWVDEYGDAIATNYGPFGIYLPIDLTSIIPGGVTFTAKDQAEPLLLDQGTEPTTVGQWSLTGSGKFMIEPADENGDPVDMESTINDLLSQQEFPINMITVQVTKYSFTGSINKDGSLKLSLALNITIDAYITNGTISLTGSFTTAKPSDQPPETYGILSTPNRSLKVSSKGLANLVVKILKTIPLKDAVPAN